MSEKIDEPALPFWLMVGFTGHRNLTDPEKVTAAIRAALDRLAILNPRLVGVSSAASGADTLFAEEMVRRNCPVTLILPFPCERFSQDFADDPKGWERSKKLMLAAINLEIISQSEIDRLGIQACTSSKEDAEAVRKRFASASYMEAGVRTVDAADVLIAVWDKQPGVGFGGTADAVKYARTLGKPVIIIKPVTGEQEQERIEALPDSVRSQESGNIQAPRSYVEKYFQSAESDANKHAPRARHLIRWSLRFNLIAAVVGVCGIVFDVGYRLNIGIGVFGLLVLVAASVMLAYRGKSYQRWLHRRAEAEVCRSFLATWNIRRHATAGHEPRPALPGLTTLFASLRLLRQMDRSPMATFENVRDTYAQDRLNDQLNYFKEKLEQARKSYRLHDWLMKICSWMAVISSVLVLVFTALSVLPTLMKFCLLFAVALPLITTALVLIIITDESSRRAVRYSEMVQVLQHYQPPLLASMTWDSLARIATSVEEELLQELVEWRSFVRHTEELH